MTSKQQQRMTTILLGLAVVGAGSFASLSLLEGHLASLGQLVGAVLGLFVLYCVLHEASPLD